MAPYNLAPAVNIAASRGMAKKKITIEGVTADARACYISFSSVSYLRENACARRCASVNRRQSHMRHSEGGLLLQTPEAVNRKTRKLIWYAGKNRCNIVLIMTGAQHQNIGVAKMAWGIAGGMVAGLQANGKNWR